MVKFVLDQTYACDITFAEEALDIAFCHFEGEVAQVSSVWWFVGKGKIGVVTRALLMVSVSLCNLSRLPGSLTSETAVSVTRPAWSVAAEAGRGTECAALGAKARRRS